MYKKKKKKQPCLGMWIERTVVENKPHDPSSPRHRLPRPNEASKGGSKPSPKTE